MLTLEEIPTLGDLPARIAAAQSVVDADPLIHRGPDSAPHHLEHHGRGVLGG